MFLLVLSDLYAVYLSSVEVKLIESYLVSCAACTSAMRAMCSKRTLTLSASTTSDPCRTRSSVRAASNMRELTVSRSVPFTAPLSMLPGYGLDQKQYCWAITPLTQFTNNCSPHSVHSSLCSLFSCHCHNKLGIVPIYAWFKSLYSSFCPTPCLLNLPRIDEPCWCKGTLGFLSVRCSLAFHSLKISLKVALKDCIPV